MLTCAVASFKSLKSLTGRKRECFVTDQSSGSQSRNPLANGLLAIFSCVICSYKINFCNVRIHDLYAFIIFLLLYCLVNKLVLFFMWGGRKYCAEYQNTTKIGSQLNSATFRIDKQKTHRDTPRCKHNTLPSSFSKGNI